LVNYTSNISKILRIPDRCLFFIHLQGSIICWQFRDFFANKSFKTYLGSMKPPGGRKWQLIYPKFTILEFS